MSSKIFPSGSLIKNMGLSIIKMTNPNIKISLHTVDPGDISGDAVWGDMTDELSGTGYTAGGESVTGIVWDYTGDTTKFDSDDIIWANLTGTFRFAIIYVDETIDGVVKPIIAKVGLDYNASDAIQDVVVTAVPYSIVWSAEGIVLFNK